MTSVIKPADIVCRKCAQVFTPGADHDPCIKNLPLVTYACCGHGDPNDDAYLCFKPTEVLAKGHTITVFDIHRMPPRKMRFNPNNHKILANLRKVSPQPYHGIPSESLGLSITVYQDFFDEIISWMQSDKPPVSPQELLDTIKSKYEQDFEETFVISERCLECPDSE